jgi:predicted signal transduction protein with EAL and GGDEF domain
VEAVGRNILFLYDDEDVGFHDAFLEQGGRLMEVRRKKKNGEVFWASLSLSPLCDINDRSIGLIAYLTDITERKMAEERIHHLAYYDALTNLPNRTLLTKLVDQALMVAQRNKAHGCVLFIDLNRFKLINDTGPQDRRRTAGGSGAPLPHRAARPGPGGAPGRRRVRGRPVRHRPALRGQHGGAKLLATLNEPFLIDGHDLRVGGSIGISVYPQDGHDAKPCCAWPTSPCTAPSRRAAMATMWPSTAGHEPGHAGTHAHRNRLRNALGNGELLLHYQPKYAIPDGKIIGAEALVRWRHPARAGAAVGIHSAGRSDRAGGAGRRMGAGDRLRAGAGVERCRPAADPAGRERLGARIHRHLPGRVATP